MKKIRIYVDTSVIGGCFDFEMKSFLPLTSSVVVEEVKLAPQEVQDQFKKFVKFSPEVIPIVTFRNPYKGLLINTMSRTKANSTTCVSGCLSSEDKHCMSLCAAKICCHIIDNTMIFAQIAGLGVLVNAPLIRE